MKVLYSFIILIFFLSCTKSIQECDQNLLTDSSSTDLIELEKSFTADDQRRPSIRYKTRFNYDTCKQQTSSHVYIYAYISNSKLILRSRTKCLTKATHLYYNDIDDYEVSIKYPSFTTYQSGAYSYLALPISRSIACVERVELTLHFGGGCGLDPVPMRN